MKHNSRKYGRRMLCAALALVTAGFIVFTGCIPVNYHGIIPVPDLSAQPAPTEQGGMITPGTLPTLPTSAPNIEPEQTEQTEPQTAWQTNAYTTKLGNIPNINAAGYKSFEFYDGGIVYTDNNDKAGILSLDGRHDSGAVYAKWGYEDKWFAVSKNAYGFSENDINSFNRFAIVDGNGRALSGEEYANFEVKGRFIIAFKATALKPDDANYSDYLFTVYYGNGNTKNFDGVWSVYDGVTGRKLSITGSFKSYFEDYGDYLRYKKADDSYAFVDFRDRAFNEDAEMLRNGTYIVSNPGVSFVCGSDGAQRFRYDPTQYTVECYSWNSGDDYHYYAKRYTSAGYDYALLDNSGNAVTGFYSSRPRPIHNMLLIGKQLFKLDGTKVLESEVDYAGEDQAFGRAILFKDSAAYYLVDGEGNLLLKVDNGSNTEIYYTTSKCGYVVRDNQSRKVYNFKTGQFDIEGFSEGGWFAKKMNGGGTYDLIDTFTGETLLVGHNSYYVKYIGDGYMFIYAKLDNQYTFFRVV